jgi:adenosylmethionine-8-amino-7-oxononanoate aminotransferase
VLLIADEIITGFGRIGPWFGLERWGVEPDLVCFAKGITSGYLPLAGVGFRKEIAEGIRSAEGRKTWMHAATYSGHPVACAVANANLDLIEREGLRERAAEAGEHLRRQLATLASLSHVGEVRGLGLMAAVELVADKSTREEFPASEKVGQRVHAATQARGMFSRLRGDVYNLAPCYCVEPAQSEAMVEILGESIREVTGA